MLLSYYSVCAHQVRYLLHYGRTGLHLIKFLLLRYNCKHILAPISGGSLFLFDRKVLRYFRKDGHNWRKKKDGKTVKEAHERLKVSILGYLNQASSSQCLCLLANVFYSAAEALFIFKIYVFFQIIVTKKNV